MLVQRSAVYLGQVSQVCATRGSYIKLHRYARHKAALHICTRWRMGGTSTAKVPSMFSVCSVYVLCRKIPICVLPYIVYYYNEKNQQFKNGSQTFYLN